MQNMPSKTEIIQKLLTQSQVAEQLQISVWSVYRRISDGQLPAVKLGDGPRAPIRVDAAELHQFVYGQGQRVGTRAKAWR